MFIKKIFFVSLACVFYARGFIVKASWWKKKDTRVLVCFDIHVDTPALNTAQISALKQVFSDAKRAQSHVIVDWPDDGYLKHRESSLLCAVASMARWSWLVVDRIDYRARKDLSTDYARRAIADSSKSAKLEAQLGDYGCTGHVVCGDYTNVHERTRQTLERLARDGRLPAQLKTELVASVMRQYSWYQQNLKSFADWRKSLVSFAQKNNLLNHQFLGGVDMFDGNMCEIMSVCSLLEAQKPVNYVVLGANHARNLERYLRALGFSCERSVGEFTSVPQEPSGQSYADWARTATSVFDMSGKPMVPVSPEIFTWSAK